MSETPPSSEPYEFIGEVTHALKHALVAVRLYLHEAQDHPRKENFKAADDAIDEALRFVRGINLLYRYRTGRVTVAPAQTITSDELVKLLTELVGQRSHSGYYQVAHTAERFIFNADRDLLDLLLSGFVALVTHVATRKSLTTYDLNAFESEIVYSRDVYRRCSSNHRA
jgi:hypothetical protein